LLVDHDLHIHTVFSNCCGDSQQIPENIIKLANESGLKKIGFSDHTWENNELEPTEWYANQGGGRINELARTVRASAIESPRIFIGCEAETMSHGKFSISQDFAATLDYVVLATDHFHFTDLVEQPSDYSPATFGRHLLKMFRAGAVAPFKNIVLAHPCLPLGFMNLYEPMIDTISDSEFLDTFAVAAEHNVALEITLSFFPDAARNRNFSRSVPVRVLSLAKQAGCKFVFGSDAHSLVRLQRIHELDFFVQELALERTDIHPLAL